ncbi:hypothetical protein [Cystobacter fuscus]|jgi:hypothetical protein|uniref:Uncharacterized protein n=2 Tax=Cystobacter fuscus TaxID=43 RepID=S9P7B1_CYSF2|nr:hypothetical protein [Cystobacter fuscus]ATB37300.1 hypothetical protein CYFUS_002721 [Cystobacter fuscus]ATB37301.1 hypothetical protein CYFUS_002722 [Cystobacter fuscus]EPX58092.1 hypothetical protein D187_004381 [Cystobacter fuscus DSM 2262]EPX58093.1 hypothetical protein D187_004382 [Cystobacter fuscus DSM 2262]WNG15492.1 hypothetical protein F0U63_13180 [Cystobacter fuscus]
MGSLMGIVGNAQGGIGGLSAAQNQMLANAPAEMKPFLEAQMKMQKEQELLQLITQMMKQMHEMAMSVIKNIGG